MFHANHFRIFLLKHPEYSRRIRLIDRGLNKLFNSFGLSINFSIFAGVRIGMWRSLVAYLHGVQGVAGSNPVIPTL